MCGICGFINFKTNLVKNERENLAVAHRMAEKLRHRGPDSWGEWVGEHAVFAHSRLAVIDVEKRTSADETYSRRTRICDYI